MNLRLYPHINTNSILVNEQFGFRTKLSTVNTTCNFVSEILDTLKNKKNKKMVAYFGIWKRTLIVLMTFYYLNWNFME